jgi:hypothetical protein
MSMGLQVRNGRWAFGALAVLALLTLPGCVERRYTLRSDPPGAIAIVNGEEIGPTPVSRSFVFYGDREISQELDGYQTLHVIQPVPAAWWDLPGIDFISENVIPFTLRDEREFTYKMMPVSNPPENELLDRAESLKQQGQLAPPPRRKGILGWLGF